MDQYLLSSNFDELKRECQESIRNMKIRLKEITGRFLEEFKSRTVRYPTSDEIRSFFKKACPDFQYESIGFIGEKKRVHLTLPEETNLDLPIVFLPNPKAGVKVNVMGPKLTCTAKCKEFNFFLNKEMVKGIFKVVFISESKDSFRYCGLAHKSKLTQMHTDAMTPQACMFGVRGIYTAGKWASIEEDLFPVSGGCVLGMELCLKEVEDGKGKEKEKGGTLHFFVNRTQIPYAVTKIPPSVHFWFNVWSRQGDFAGEVQSFQQLSAPTADTAMQCAEYVWG